jgi:hypothetical protein
LDGVKLTVRKTLESHTPSRKWEPLEWRIFMDLNVSVEIEGNGSTARTIRG